MNKLNKLNKLNKSNYKVNTVSSGPDSSSA